MPKRSRNSKTGSTRATVALTRAGYSFEVVPYEIDPESADATMGEAAAAALGVPPAQVFKTLLAEVDGRAVCAVVPSSASLALKVLAAAAGGKRAAMADPADAERITGYVTGGISPVGQTKTLDMFVDATVILHEHVFVSAGQRGLQLRLTPRTLLAATGAESIESLGRSG